MCSDPEDTKNGSYNGHCEGTANVKTKIGNKEIAGDGKAPGLGSCGGFGQKKCRTSSDAEAKIGPKSTVTPTPSVTPKTTSTPCPQAFICGLPTSTITPTPHSEPIPPALPAPQLSMNVEFYIDLNQVDGIDFAIDLAGIWGDVGMLLPSIATYSSYGASEVAEGAGLVKSFVDLTYGDPTNALYQQAETTLEKAALVAFRVERLAPYVGFIGNLGSMYMTLNPKFNVTITYK